MSGDRDTVASATCKSSTITEDGVHLIEAKVPISQSGSWFSVPARYWIMMHDA